MTLAAFSINTLTHAHAIPYDMKTIGRWIPTGLLVIMLGFCVFGLVTTFQPLSPLERTIWRTVYALVGAAGLCGLVRPLRYEFRRVTRR